jgi:hypothetical protein
MMRLESAADDHLEQARQALGEARLHHLRALSGWFRQGCSERYRHHVNSVVWASKYLAHLRSHVQSNGDPAREVQLRQDWRKLQRSMVQTSRKLEAQCFLKKPRR